MKRVKDKILKEISYQTGNYTIAPEFLSLIITFRCNFRCRTCSIWQKDNYDELNKGQWKNIINKLTSNLPSNTFVEINGGEPLIRKDLTLLCIGELKKYFKRVTLNSNGSLINKDILDQLKNVSLDVIKISFYSLDKEIHNNLRGDNRAFDGAKKAIKLISQSDIDLEVGLLLTKKNMDQVGELIEYLEKIPGTSIILQPLDEKVESKESKDLKSNNLISDLWPTKKQVNTFFDYINDHKKFIKNSDINLKAIKDYYLEPKSVLKYRCFAGQRNLVIYPNGDLSFCFKGPKIGSLKQGNLKNILKNTAPRKNIKKCHKYCRIVGCNFSRGLKEFFRIS